MVAQHVCVRERESDIEIDIYIYREREIQERKGYSKLA